MRGLVAIKEKKSCDAGDADEEGDPKYHAIFLYGPFGPDLARIIPAWWNRLFSAASLGSCMPTAVSVPSSKDCFILSVNAGGSGPCAIDYLYTRYGQGKRCEEGYTEHCSTSEIDTVEARAEDLKDGNLGNISKQ